MSKNVNKLVAIITVGVVLSVPMISNAKNVVYSSDVATGTPIATETPSEKELTKSDFKHTAYFVGGTLFTITDVDDFVNPKYFYDDFYDEYHPIKNFENVNEFIKKSSNPEDYVPEGYIFKGWEVIGYDDDYEATVVDAILEKDQDYIDNMQTKIEVSINTDRSITMNYIDETSSSKLVSLKYSIEGIGTTYREFKEFYTSEDYKNCFITNVAYIDDLAKTNSLTYHRYFYPDDYSAHSAVGNKFTVKAEAVNDLGKVTTFEKVYDKKDLFRSVDMITTISSPFYLDSSNLPYVEIPEEVYFGDRIYVYNLPEDVRNNKSYLDFKRIHHDETGYYFIIDKMFMSSCDTENYVNKHLDIGDFDAKSFTDYYELHIGDFYFTKALKVHNISRDGKSVAFGELPKQDPSEVVEPATETPAEPATKTPEEVKPAEPATKTPEETKPAKPSKTSDASNVAVALVGLTLTGAVVVKTKKNA